MKISQRKFAAALGIAQLLAVSEAAAQMVSIDVANQKHSIRGFGGINHPVWIGDLTAVQRDAAFGNGRGKSE